MSVDIAVLYQSAQLNMVQDLDSVTDPSALLRRLDLLVIQMLAWDF